MDINTFYSRNLEERMALINHSGEFITRIKFYGYYINLYAVDYELVEVYYNGHTNAIEEVEILHPKDERLHVYAVRVNLSDLFS